MNVSPQFRGAHACSVLVIAFCDHELPSASATPGMEANRWQHRRKFARQNASASTLQACAPLISIARASIIGALAFSITGYAAQTPLAEIPFRRDGQLLMVEARINDGAPALFLVDTGASHTVFDPTFAKELGLQVEEAAPTTGTGRGEVPKSHAPPVVMNLNGLKIDVPQPWVIDLSKAPMSSSVRGLVGAEMFKNYVVRMDPVRLTLSVFDPASYRYEGDGASLPLLVEGDKLFLEATLEVPAGKKVTHKLRIDTGSESSVNDEIVQQSEELRSSTLGGGLGENFKSYSGVFTSVKIGPYEINHVWGPGGTPPSVGMEVLRRFIITFDAPRRRIYLEPTAALAEPVPTPPPES